MAELGEADGRGYREYVALNARIRDALRPEGPDDLWLADPPSRELIEDRLGGDEVAIATLFEDSYTTMLERFFSEPVVDALAGQGVIGTFASPRDPGTASIAWHHSSGRLTGYPGAWTYVRGGMGRVSFALADAAREAGAVIATGVPVGGDPARRGRRARGRHARARRATVVCNADPRRALALLDGAAPAGVPRARRGRALREPGAEGQLRALGHPALPAGRSRDARDGQRDRRRRRAATARAALAAGRRGRRRAVVRALLPDRRRPERRPRRAAT